MIIMNNRISIVCAIGVGIVSVSGVGVRIVALFAHVSMCGILLRLVSIDLAADNLLHCLLWL